MNRFWDYAENELRLEGEISSETWYGDEVTPKAFRAELEKHPGPITVYINSPGGDVFAASEIYTMLLERRGDVTVKIDSLAASAASIIAMAGGRVLMAPTAYLMIHDPLTAIYGNRTELKKAIETLDEIKEGLINAYELKTGLSRDKISALMDKETWLSAYSAMELGFADGLLGQDGQEENPEPKPEENSAGLPIPFAAKGGKLCVFARTTYSDMLAQKIADSVKPAEVPEETQEAKELRARLIALADKYHF